MTAPLLRARRLHQLVLGLAFACLLVSTGLAATILVVAVRDPLSVEAAPHRPSGAALPLAEISTTGSGDTFVLLLTGVAGWNRGDRGFAHELALRGYPTVALDSFRYFSVARDRRAAAADLDRIVETYARAWGRPRVILAGYSFGASPALMLWRDLSPRTRARVIGVALVAPERRTDLRIHPYSFWTLDNPGAIPSESWLGDFRNVRLVCIYAPDDRDAACPDYPVRLSEPHPLGGGHLFLGYYPDVAQAILATRRPPQASR